MNTKMDIALSFHLSIFIEQSKRLALFQPLRLICNRKTVGRFELRKEQTLCVLCQESERDNGGNERERQINN